MNALAAESVGYADLLRDVRHMDARAAGDLADWLAYLEVEGKADRSLYAYMRVIARLLNRYPEHELADFTDSDIERFLATIPRPSRHVPRSIVGKWFEWAKLKKRIRENPMDAVAKVRPPHHRPRDIFTAAEVAALEALPTPDGPLFSLLFGSGLRRTEAIQLRLEHVDLARQRLIVLDGKGGKDRLCDGLLPCETCDGIGAVDYDEQATDRGPAITDEFVAATLIAAADWPDMADALETGAPHPVLDQLDGIPVRIAYSRDPAKEAVVQEALGREHVLTADCWCQPTATTNRRRNRWLIHESTL